MRRSLTTTTAIIASLSILAPHASLAQAGFGAGVACPPENTAECALLQSAGIEVNRGSLTRYLNARDRGLSQDEALAQVAGAVGDAPAQEQTQQPTQQTAEQPAPQAAPEADTADTEAAVERAIEDAQAEVAPPATTRDGRALTAEQAERNAAAQAARDAAAEVERLRTERNQANQAARDAADSIDAQAQADAAQAELEAALEASRAATEQQSAAAAALNAESADSEVERTTVTEESVRSSDEDFDTAINSDASAEDDDGPSNLEKALVAGAGALAIGSLIQRNRSVVSTSDDRVVVQRQDGTYEVLKDDDTLLRRAGDEVQTQTFSDGSTRTVVDRPDGSQIVTIRDNELRVLRRTRITPDGQEIMLIDDTVQSRPVDVALLSQQNFQPATTVNIDDQAALRAALQANRDYDRSYSLAQIRDISQVRNLAPAISLDSLTFASGSAAIQPEQAQQLVTLGQAIQEEIDADPREVFLVEGHTDAVGDAAYNLALSDRRAESVALALTEYFDVPPENLVVQGYGERFLKIQTEADERANRRVTVRRITPLLQTAAAN